MNVVHGLAELDALALGERDPERPSLDARSATLVGVFDGVHLGHQRLLHELTELASATRALPTLVTFRNHPDEVLRGRRVDWIVSLPHRLRLLRRAGIERVVLLEFDAALRSMTAAEFTARILVRGLATKALLLGYDSAIGKNREGTPERLAELGAGSGFEVHQGTRFEVDGQPVSSTAIRAAITSGDLDAAHRMLGRWPAAFGEVRHGDSRGRGLGFATANLEPQSLVLPPAGVYAVQAIHDGRVLHGVANLGARPTFAADAAAPKDRAPEVPRLEVHLFDFDADLYGATLEVAFVARLRDERRFESVEALTAQITQDALAARRILGDTLDAPRTRL